MTVYAIAQLSIHDPQRYERYASRFLATLRPYDGTLLAADDGPEVIEGEWESDKVVLLAFDSPQRFRQWATSEEYRRITGDRTGASSGSVLLVKGLSVPPSG